ncbi:TraR/DksA family transcriptional regulator [Gaopeijia maritima]|uniref:DksA C4-type domain-containing protein n=1 Tax=Gaopeijia maritima TaxID=3119007 RepID=A0ABU9E685_9BACT
MNDTIRNELESRLLEERDRLQEDLDHAVEESRDASDVGDLSNLKSHPADSGTQEDEADTDLRIAERATERINRIDAALTRLREQPDEFGRCEVEGKAIAIERLRLVPWTTRCAEHAPPR